MERSALRMALIQAESYVTNLENTSGAGPVTLKDVKNVLKVFKKAVDDIEGGYQANHSDGTVVLDQDDLYYRRM
jgi:hypothetical protein